MTLRASPVLLFFLIALNTSFSESADNNGLSAAAFYSTPEEIIEHFKKESPHSRNNYILAGAFRDKKNFKRSLLYYANSCFEQRHNFSLKLFALPLYLFVEHKEGRTIFYQDAVYNIASILFEYNEHVHVIKLAGLIQNDHTALYRDSVLLRSRSLQKLNRLEEAAESLQRILKEYKDSESRSLIFIRLGSVYESAGDYSKAAGIYLDVVRSKAGVWQNRAAAKRLNYLTDEKEVIIETSEEIFEYALALADLGDYEKALDLTEKILLKEKSYAAEKLKIKILSVKNGTRAAAFLKTKKDHTDYKNLELEYADALWNNRKKADAVKIYHSISDSDKNNLPENIQVRLADYYQKRNDPLFVKHMEHYISAFPHSHESPRFLWLMGRHYMRLSDNKNALTFFNRCIADYPANIYTSYCRFWKDKLSASDKSSAGREKFIEELAFHNPDSYHALSILKKEADKTDTAILAEKFSKARECRDKKKMLLYHSLLFIKNGYDGLYSKRLKQLPPEITEPYAKLTSLIQNPVYSGDYGHIIKRIETCYYSGDIKAVNKELKLIPEDDHAAGIDIALAITVNSVKHRIHGHSTFYGFRLLKLLNLKENTALFDRTFSEALYPYAFSECVKKYGNKYKIKPELILAMMKSESNFNHTAQSPSGAIGLMQLMPGTAKSIARQIKAVKYSLSDPCTSIQFGTHYLAWLDKYYNGQIEYMTAGYNAGIGNLNKWIKRKHFDEIDFFSEFIPYIETRDYIFKTKKFLIQYESIYK